MQPSYQTYGSHVGARTPRAYIDGVARGTYSTRVYTSPPLAHDGIMHACRNPRS